MDHVHTDAQGQSDRLIELSFKHPYLMHTLLALSALHMLHGSDDSDPRLYALASTHNLAATQLARPQVARSDAEHRDAVYNFAALSSLYALAEPPLRTGPTALQTSTETIVCLLQAFRMGKGILAVQDPFKVELEASGSLKPELWKDNKDDVLLTLDADYPQMTVLTSIVDDYCHEQHKDPCRAAIRDLFISIAVLATNHKNHSSLHRIMTWPMHLDPACLQMFEMHDPVGLVILAHYAALMSMRRNYWFFNRWPTLLLDSIADLIRTEWREHLRWPRELMSGHQQSSISRNP